MDFTFTLDSRMTLITFSLLLDMDFTLTLNPNMAKYEKRFHHLDETGSTKGLFRYCLLLKTENTVAK